MRHLLSVKAVVTPMSIMKVSVSSRLKMGRVGNITNYKKKGAVWPLFYLPPVNWGSLYKPQDGIAGYQVA